SNLGPSLPIHVAPACALSVRLTPRPHHFFQLFQKMNVPRLVDVISSGAPSLSRSDTASPDPTPDRLWMSSGTNSAPPGALGLRTVRYTYNTGGPCGSGS